MITKTDLTNVIADAHNVSNAEAARIVQTVLGKVTDALRAGDEVRLHGFGTFAVTDRAASEGRNPRTGEKIAIAAKRQPKFKAAKALTEALNG